VVSQLEALGVEGAAPGGGFLQKVPLVGVETHVASPPRFAGQRGALTLEPGALVANARGCRARRWASRGRAGLVGYGIVAPEYRWDDYAGVDVRGKVVLVMNDDPSRRRRARRSSTAGERPHRGRAARPAIGQE